MRLFLAVRPSPEVLQFALFTQDTLRSVIDRQGVRFAAPTKMHLTLAFLGDDADPETTIATANRFLPGSGKLSLTVGGIGTFPSAERPKTIWLGVHGADLGRLAATTQQEYALPETPYVGHLTLARVSPGSKTVGRLLMPLADNNQEMISWEATEVELMLTLPNGEYETLGRYFL